MATASSTTRTRPHEKGKADPDPTKNGCPAAVRVTEKEIIILEKVEFDTAKATIKPVRTSCSTRWPGCSRTIREILLVEVQGHTDNQGAKGLNEGLSTRRAKAVVDALVKRGIAKQRLSSKGFGQDKPIADNDTPDGRQKNRRVQFEIQKRAEKEPQQ